MSDDYGQRITALESTQRYHAQSIRELRAQTKDIGAHLTRIQQTMDKIFWTVLGGGAVLVLSHIGAIEFIKRVLL